MRFVRELCLGPPTVTSIKIAAAQLPAPVPGSATATSRSEPPDDRPVLFYSAVDPRSGPLKDPIVAHLVSHDHKPRRFKLGYYPNGTTNLITLAPAARSQTTNSHQLLLPVTLLSNLSQFQALLSERAPIRRHAALSRGDSIRLPGADAHGHLGCRLPRL